MLGHMKDKISELLVDFKALDVESFVAALTMDELVHFCRQPHAAIQGIVEKNSELSLVMALSSLSEVVPDVKLQPAALMPLAKLLKAHELSWSSPQEAFEKMQKALADPLALVLSLVRGLTAQEVSRP